MVKGFFFSFVTLFLAIDPLGLLPVYVSLTKDVNRRNEVLRSSIFTALIVGVTFLFVGKTLFRILGITVSDFQIAGGILLLALSLRDLLAGKSDIGSAEDIGIVPLGTPLIAGPATLTAIIVCSDLYGGFITLIAYAVNLGVTYLFFVRSDALLKALGNRGAQGIAKVTNLLLAAFAVSFIRRGILKSKLCS